MRYTYPRMSKKNVNSEKVTFNIHLKLLGGGATNQSDSEEEDKEVMDCLSRQTSTRRQSVLTSLNDIGNTNATNDDTFLNISNCSSNLSGLCQATTLLTSVKGGKSEDGSDDDDVDGNIMFINDRDKLN